MAANINANVPKNWQNEITHAFLVLMVPKKNTDSSEAGGPKRMFQPKSTNLPCVSMLKY